TPASGKSPPCTIPWRRRPAPGELRRGVSRMDPAIAEFYQRTPEEARLTQGPFQLEEARTRELIQRFAPPPPGTVLDVGGAAGAYALWLVGAGYEVHLVDAAPRLVEEARRRSTGAGLS